MSVWVKLMCVCFLFALMISPVISGLIPNKTIKQKSKVIILNLEINP